MDAAKPSRSQGSARITSKIPAGLIDSGFSSAATFAVGIYAAREFSAVELGVYALLTTAFLLAQRIPQQLIFVPSEVSSLEYPEKQRLRLFETSLRIGALPVLGSVIFLPAVTLLVPAGFPFEYLGPMILTATITGALWPVQDHVRRVLHIAKASWSAAGVSVVQLVVVVAALLGLTAADVPAAWIPFGALAIANFTSLSVGLLSARIGGNGQPKIDPLTYGRLLASGRWLLLSGGIPQLTQFAVAAVVTQLAGSEALGFAESARIVAQPVLVLSVGLSSVTGPRSMESAAYRNSSDARRVMHVYSAVLLGIGLPYSALAAWPGSPWQILVPNAYAVSGLVLLTLLANISNGLSAPLRAEILGGRREPQLARMEFVGNGLRLIVGGFSGALRAYSVPVGFLVLGVVRWIMAAVGRRAVYLGESDIKE